MHKMAPGLYVHHCPTHVLPVHSGLRFILYHCLDLTSPAVRAYPCSNEEMRIGCSVELPTNVFLASASPFTAFFMLFALVSRSSGTRQEKMGMG